MVNKPKNAGTAAETAVVRWLTINGHPWAERRSLHGGTDKGDITGVPGIVFEVKAGRTIKLREWLRETFNERLHANADYGVLIIKPVGYGTTRTGQWWAVMHNGDWERLLHCVGMTAEGGTVFTLSGNKITELPEVMKVSRLPLEEPGASVLVVAKGMRDPRLHYRVTTLESLNAILLQAGYGTSPSEPGEPTQTAKIEGNSTGGVAHEEHDDSDGTGGTVGC